jgi:hypothetical protein
MDTSILNNETDIIGHIYLITNIQLNKHYVGQTLSHRKNRNKYRPFGYIGRFNDHISEALCNTKKKQCTYLNNAIRLYGKESFTVRLITTCSREELDSYEKKYITEYDSLYPNGYNLTRGGKVFREMIPSIEPTCPVITPKKRGGCTHRTSETRAKMTARLKEVMGTDEAKHEQMLRSQKQHQAMKLKKFTGLILDDNLEKYIKLRKAKDGSNYIKVIVGEHTTSFTGKYESIEVLKQKALHFLQSIQSSATLPNCSGNP